MNVDVDSVTLYSLMSTGEYDAVSDIYLIEYHECNGGNMRLSTGLIAVKKNNKWGYVRKQSNQIAIPIEYDNKEYFAYNRILILSKNGKQGGVFIDKHWSNQQAFEFKYNQLCRMFNQTYSFCNSDGTYSLVKPGDIVISNHRYASFDFNDHQRIITYRRYDFFGRLITGRLDLETGQEFM